MNPESGVRRAAVIALSMLLAPWGGACNGTVEGPDLSHRDASFDASSLSPPDAEEPETPPDAGRARADAAGFADASAAGLDAEVAPADASAAGLDAAPMAGPDAAAPLVDDSEIVSANLPDSLACGERRSVTLSLRNKGTTTWTDGPWKLGAVGDSDPFTGITRFDLGQSVPATAVHDFTFDLVAPHASGTFTSDWQMVHDAAWFGAIVRHDIAVTCPLPDGETVLASATIVNSPPDTASWPVTTQITGLFLGANGVRVDFGKKEDPNRWPDVVPPGWDGPLQYTLWLAMYVNGSWTASGIIQFWYGLDAGGGDVTQNDQIAKNWVYDARWGALMGHQPAPGEFVGFMVTAGNERGVLDASQAPVRERSDMVIIAFPSASNSTFTF